MLAKPRLISALPGAADADTKGTSTSIANSKKGDATANSNVDAASAAIGKKEGKTVCALGY